MCIRLTKHILYYSVTSPSLLRPTYASFSSTHLAHGRRQVVTPRAFLASMASQPQLETKVLPVDATKLGNTRATARPDDLLDELDIDLLPNSTDAQHIRTAAEQLRTSHVPVAFPTETVYGLGADATRSEAVLGIYKAKQRPADNPLIVHFGSLDQLRTLLRPASADRNSQDDPIPSIYHPLIRKFWPGPLTLILPNPADSPLAPEVTAGLSTFGARMPRHVLALALIKLSGKPIAAPSANASTKPSPTAAEHVAYDLDGRIETIIDGGPCDVGVESTVVDGLSSPPLILRPGGISIEQLRECEGWGDVRVGYQDVSQKGGEKPRAPGMKYRHYAPKATVVLFESGRKAPSWEDMQKFLTSGRRVGVVRTGRWRLDLESETGPISQVSPSTTAAPLVANGHHATASGFAGMLQTMHKQHEKQSIKNYAISRPEIEILEVLDLNLGSDTADIARGVFAALRDMDRQNVGAIFVEGISDAGGDVAAAVMNRLRKAAEVKIDG